MPLLEKRIAWIKRPVLNYIVIEANRSFPYETGGCLMGYWGMPLREVVITDIIGPGPQAVHRKKSFIPDNEWQTAEVARIYANSGRLHTYLGDWHTHPNSNCCELSWTDSRTLNKIAIFHPARIPTPIMGVLAGGSSWDLKIWSYASPKKLTSLFGNKNKAMEIMLFD